MGLFSRRKKEPELPNNLFDRIGTAAAGIHFVLNKKGLTAMPKDPDICIWENCGYVLAELKEAGILNRSDWIHFYRKMSELYVNNDEKRASCISWLSLSSNFYYDWIRRMVREEHPQPDVIVYNITHPSQYRKDFDNIPLFEMDMFKIQEAWAYISNIMLHYFFRKDENIESIPKNF